LLDGGLSQVPQRNTQLMKNPNKMKTTIIEELRTEGHADSSEIAASFNALLLAAKQTLELAQEFAPCNGPSASVQEAIQKIESCKL
jgi:hypothetical protein